jgi:phosphoribosylaminoimidazolecarboxamide formyltransferase/IMP cyclohydrolase
LAPDEAGRVPIRRALLSVFDVSGLSDFAGGLRAVGVELWATEGTRQTLSASGHEARPAEELTGIGSWFSGRIKTLHPGILGGILAPRTPEGMQELAQRGLLPLDLVVVNFYPFERRFAEAPEASDLVESIDVGGVTLARAAAKNHSAVTVVTSPTEYDPLLRELQAHAGAVSATTRRSLAARAFGRVAAYDRSIASALTARADPLRPFPETLRFVRDPEVLRYGENPHQAAQPYLLEDSRLREFTPVPLELLKGEPLSFTNLLDLETALETVAEFPTPSAAVVKHATPTGVASGSTVREALERAVATDPLARYGCIVAVNRPLATGDTAPLHGVFVDLLCAPEIDPGERAALGTRKKLKLVRAASPDRTGARWELRSALGRLLVQEVDRRELRPEEFRLVTTHRASPEGTCSLDFAWRTVRHVKSNAVVLAQGSRTVGIGSGQPTRVKAVQIACEVAGDRANGAVLASDAFFPFADGVEVAARAGVSAIIQPGGSVRDPEVIAAAERSGIAMYLTGWRVFRH